MVKHIHLIFFLFAILALVFLAFGYWGSWIAHPAAGLNILGVDLPEYVKFVPEVRDGIISLNRLIFFAIPVALALGLIFLASVRAVLPLWIRGVAAASALPVALSMLPPAWSPGLLMTSEFRVQTIIILGLIVSVFLIPVWKQVIPDWLRGALFSLISLFLLPALRSFFLLLPALEKLYHRSLLAAGPGVWWTVTGTALMLLAGGLLLLTDVRFARDGC